MDKNQEQVNKVEKTYKELLTIAKGEKSPTFENYENFNGGTNSLSDFKENTCTWISGHNGVDLVNEKSLF